MQEKLYLLDSYILMEKELSAGSLTLEHVDWYAYSLILQYRAALNQVKVAKKEAADRQEAMFGGTPQSRKPRNRRL